MKIQSCILMAGAIAACTVFTSCGELLMGHRYVRTDEYYGDWYDPHKDRYPTSRVVHYNNVATQPRTPMKKKYDAKSAKKNSQKKRKVVYSNQKHQSGGEIHDKPR